MSETQLQLNNLKETKDKFVQDLINVLNEENKERIKKSNKELLDVCFMVSVLDNTNIESCKEFLQDISNNYYINSFESASQIGEDYYCIGGVTVSLDHTGENCYHIIFLNYSTDNDWFAPRIQIQKVKTKGDLIFEDKFDYQEYELRFHIKEEKYIKQIQEQLKERRKQELMKKINLLNQELISLEC